MKKRDMIRYTITGVFLFAAAGTAFDDQMLVPMICTIAAAIAFFAKKKTSAKVELKTDVNFNNISHGYYSTERVGNGR